MLQTLASRALRYAAGSGEVSASVQDRRQARRACASPPPPSPPGRSDGPQSSSSEDDTAGLPAKVCDPDCRVIVVHPFVQRVPVCFARLFSPDLCSRSVLLSFFKPEFVATLSDLCLVCLGPPHESRDRQHELRKGTSVPKRT